MNCDEFWKEMPELGPELSAAQMAHLEVCRACAAQWGGQKALAAGLRALADQASARTAPSRVEARLRTAFRGETGGGEWKEARSWWQPVLSWSPAAAAVVGLALLLAYARRPETPPKEAAPAVRMAAEQIPSLALSELLDSDDAAAAGSDFIPLPYASRIGPNDDLNLVRVELPRSAMAPLGIPESAAGAAEMVEADLVLGPDGMARAIRFVR
ncbi:MAG TPA: hypothetical protein VG675_24320 [Bryobacteraceae bacterium]|nr:hypothetical protein [Bryobacteraceae bacterium]